MEIDYDNMAIAMDHHMTALHPVVKTDVILPQIVVDIYPPHLTHVVVLAV
jgi:hypothetical protein